MTCRLLRHTSATSDRLTRLVPGLQPNPYTYNALLKVMTARGDMGEQAFTLLTQMHREDQPTRCDNDSWQGIQVRGIDPQIRVCSQRESTPASQPVHLHVGD